LHLITLYNTHTHTTILDETSAWRRDLYLTTHKTHRHPCRRGDSNHQSH